MQRERSSDRGSGARAAAVPRFRVQDDPERAARLAAMKRRATGLLVGFAAVFVVTRLLEGRYPWLGYLRATAEAAMVGGLADWFAVTALFRHPLGLPIPHTAIIKERKDRIGRSLGGFVQNNFLSREVVAARISGMHPGERIARWIADPENARRIAHHVAAGLVGAAHVLRDDEVEELIRRGIVRRLRTVRVAPLLGKLLSVLTADGRHQELLDSGLRLAARAVTENEEVIRNRIREESPWWLPEAVDDKIHEKIVGAIERTLNQVAIDPDHPLRARFDDALEEFTTRLQTSPAAIARAEAIKEDLLTHPAVREFASSLWSEAKEGLANYAARSEATGPGAIERGLSTLGRTILNDPALLEKVDGWVLDAVLYAVEQYRGEVADLIAHTVDQWDADAASERIELQIGRDLQFIRINGTLVGGLVGLILYTLSQLL